MLGSGALVVLAEGTDLLAAATNVLRFFRNESCGKCVPCRVGSAKAHTHAHRAARARRRPRRRERRRSSELEETHAPDLDLRARPGRAGPGGQRAGPGGGGTEARRRLGGAEQAPSGTRRDRSAAAPREFFTTRTVAEALAGLPARPGARRLETVPLADALHRVPAEAGHRAAPRCPASPARPWTATRCGPPTPTAPPRACPATSTLTGAVRMGAAPESRRRPGRRVADAHRRRAARRARTPWSWSSTPRQPCPARSR